MITALILDHEIEAVNGFRDQIRENFKGMRVAATMVVADLDRFTKLLRQHQPQLLIMDIRFFGANGINVITKTHIAFPDMKFMIYGTYDDTEYMEKVANFGVVEFLYRPISVKEFRISIERIIKVFDEINKKRLREAAILRDYERNRDAYRQLFIRDLFVSNMAEPDILRQMEYYGIKIAANYVAIAVKIQHDSDEDNGRNLLAWRVVACAQGLADGRGLVFLDSPERVYCLFGGIRDNDEALLLAAELRARLDAAAEMTAFIGVGRVYPHAGGIRASVKEAVAAAGHGRIVGRAAFIPIDCIEPDNFSFAYPARVERDLIKSALDGDFDQAEKNLTELMAALGGWKILPPRYIAKIIMGICMSISRKTAERGLDLDSIFREFFNFSEVFALSTTNEAEAFMQASLKAFCAHMRRLRREAAADLAKSAAEYISENYMNRITTTKIANALGCIPEYLGRIFMEHQGSSIGDFMAKIRINHAKSIMGGESLGDEDIAERVGFSDGRHLRGIFKRYEGMTTADYRRTLRSSSNKEFSL